MATAKQIAWRKKFAAMAKAGTLRKGKRRAKATTSKRRKRATGSPSPAQLRARRQFAAMAKARAKVARKNGGRKRNGLLGKLFRRKARVGARKTQRGRRRVAPVGYKRTQRGKPKAGAFSVVRRQKNAVLKGVGRRLPKYFEVDYKGKGNKARRRAKLGIEPFPYRIPRPGTGGRGPGRRLPNPQRAFNAFRGRPVRQHISTFAANGTPRDLKECGKMVDLKLRGGKTIRFSGAARLCHKGNRLYITGARFRRPNPPGEVDYGEILRICYKADKPHLESDGKTRPYEHRFGEEGGIRPHLVVDAEGLPIISGGSYTVPLEGIRD